MPPEIDIEYMMNTFRLSREEALDALEGRLELDYRSDARVAAGMFGMSLERAQWIIDNRLPFLGEDYGAETSDSDEERSTPTGD